MCSFACVVAVGPVTGTRRSYMAAAVAVGDVRGADLVRDRYETCKQRSRWWCGQRAGAGRVRGLELLARAANVSRAGAIDAGGVPLYEISASSVR